MMERRIWGFSGKHVNMVDDIPASHHRVTYSLACYLLLGINYPSVEFSLVSWSYSLLAWACIRPVCRRMHCNLVLIKFQYAKRFSNFRYEVCSEGRKSFIVLHWSCSLPLKVLICYAGLSLISRLYENLL